MSKYAASRRKFSPVVQQVLMQAEDLTLSRELFSIISDIDGHEAGGAYLATDGRILIVLARSVRSVRWAILPPGTAFSDSARGDVYESYRACVRVMRDIETDGSPLLDLWTPLSGGPSDGRGALETAAPASASGWSTDEGERQ